MTSTLRVERMTLARRLLAMFVALAAAASYFVVSAQPSSAKTLIPLQIGAPVVPVVGLTPELSGPAGWAIEQGKANAILAKYGYSYGGFVGFDNGPPPAQALASGSIQIAAIGDAPAVLSRAAGQPNRAILMQNEPGGVWIVARDGGPTSFADLKGEKVGSQFGSDFDHYL